MDTDSFIVYIKIDYIYKDIADVETRFDASNYELDRPLPKEKNKRVIGLMKDELGENIMIRFVVLRVKTYSYLIDDGNEDKKEKDTTKCVIKRKLKFENYKNCLEATQPDNKINYLEKNEINVYNLKKDHKKFIKSNKLLIKTQQRFKNEKRNVFTETTNKIALSSNDDKRMQSIDYV